MRIGVIGGGRVLNHYFNNVFLHENWLTKNELNIYSNSYMQQNLDIINGRAIQTSNTYSELIDWNPECVFVLTPSGDHYSTTMDLLSRGINVLCEKPLALRLDEIDAMSKEAKRNKVSLAPVFQNRLNPTIAKAKQLLTDESIGKINLASIRLHWCRYQDYYEDKWHGKWKMDGGVISQQAIHHIDALIYLNGPISKVCSYMCKLQNELEAEDSHLALLRHANGAIGTLEVTTAIRPADSIAEVSLHGSKGSIVVDGIALNKIGEIKTGNKAQEDEAKRTSYEVENGYGYSHRAVVDNVLDHLSNQSPLEVSVESAIDVHKVLHALYSSAETGSSWVDVESCQQSMRLGL